MIQIEKLWNGADFIFSNQRYCILEMHGKEKEVIATKITYDEPHVTGNVIVSFDFNQKVEYCPRKELKEKTKWVLEIKD